MADANYLATGFLGGEWSKSYQGRIDHPDYRKSLNVCLNGMPIEAGSWTRRPGTRFVATMRNGQPGKLIKFDFEEATPNNIALTDGMLRFTYGPALVMTNDAQAVLSISTANPAVVQTTTAHGWSSGNQVAFNTLAANDPLLQNRQFVITVVDSTHFSLADPITAATIDGSTLGTFVSGNVTRILEITSPYTGSDWSSTRSIQAEKTAVLVNGGYMPQALTVTADPVVSPASFATFSLSPINFRDGPYLDPVAGGAIVTPGATTGIVNLVVTLPAYSSTKAYTTGDFVLSSSVSYQSLIDQNLNNTPASTPTAWKVVTPATPIGPNGFVATDVGRLVRLFDSAKHWTWGKITALLNIISGTLSGAVHIGTLTSSGGLAAAFDGVTAKISTASAETNSFTSVAPSATFPTSAYVGQNYSGASTQVIYSVAVLPPSDVGLAYANTTPPGAGFISIGCVVNLRAKQTAPASSSDGTLLGTYTSETDAAQSRNPTVITTPITITSSDQSTAWNYVWVEIVATAQNLSSSTQTIFITLSAAQIQFIGPPSGSSAGVKIEILGPDLASTTAITVWRLGLYSGSTGWPTCGTYHEGRLWLSGSVGNRIDSSRSNDLYNFAPTEVDGTVSDSCAIDYTFDAPDVNTIFWMDPDQQGIVCGTQAGEWLVQASALNSPLTPTSMQAHRVTKVGCANIEPRRAEHTLVFVQKFQRKVMEYFADVYSGKFSAPNLSEKAKHLTVLNIEEIAYQQEKAPLIWARCGDGSLIGATYKRESLMSSQGPSFVGWHRHTLGSGRVVESLCVGPSVGGNLDTLAMVTNDAATNVRHIELMTDIFEEGTTGTAAWFADNAVVPTYTQNVVLGGVSSFQMFGLWHLNGKTVSVMCGGLDVGDCVVANGAASISFGAAGGLFTTAFVSSFAGAMPVVVGFAYTSQGQLVRPATPPESGARMGPAIGKLRRTQYASALLYATQDIKLGTSFTRMNQASLTTDGGTPLAANVLFTGTLRHVLTDGESFDSMICWQNSRLYPCNIAAMGGFLQTKDS